MRISVHNDEATDVDKLNREQYAEAFARLAESCDTPLVIGLYGSWGIGKTSLMKLIERKLNPENSRSVWFDPWQHQFDETPALVILRSAVYAAGNDSAEVGAGNYVDANCRRLCDFMVQQIGSAAGALL